MAYEAYLNGPQSALNGAINNSVTSIVVVDGSVFSGGDGFQWRAAFEDDTDEIVLVTGRSTNTLTVTRGAEGTTAVSHLTAVNLVSVLTKAAVESVVQVQDEGTIVGEVRKVNFIGPGVGAALNGTKVDVTVSAMVNPMTQKGDLIVGAGPAGSSVDEALGKSYFAYNGVFGYSNLSFAFDNDDATAMTMGGSFGNGHYLGADLGVATAITYFRCKSNTVTQFAIDSSTDGSTWTTRYTSASSSFTDTGVLALGSTITARYWRWIQLIGPDGLSIYSLEFRSAGTVGAPERLAVGSDGQIPTADSTATNGVAYGKEILVPDVKLSGLTGATAATRYGGGTTSGAPTTGTWVVGDYVIAQDGHVWVCTGAGTPGTWIDVGVTTGMTDPTTTKGDLLVKAGAVSADLIPASVSLLDQTTDSNSYTIGNEFSTTAATPITGLAWYRAAVGDTAPTTLCVWDTTNSTAVLTITSGIVDSGAIGWQVTQVPTPQAFTTVAARHYRVTEVHPVGAYSYFTTTLTPDSGISFHASSGGGGYYVITGTNTYPTTASSVKPGVSVRVTTSAGTLSRFPVGTDGQIPTVDSTTTSGIAYGKEILVPDLKVSGITGAVSSVRLVGGNASGPPTTGTFAVRDAAIDSAGAFWICTVAGTPGTWVQSGTGSSGPPSGTAGGALAGTYPNPDLGASGILAMQVFS